MAEQKGSRYNLRRGAFGPIKRSARKRAYFYIDGDLYRTLSSDRANDLIRAWSFTDEKIVNFVYSDVMRTSQQAFDTKDVANFLNRTPENILAHLRLSAINRPVVIGRVLGKKPGTYKWSEDDIRALHEHYLTLGAGRPRLDGIVHSAPRIPSRLELAAMMKQHKMYFVQDANGNFVPIFDQPDWT